MRPCRHILASRFAEKITEYVTLMTHMGRSFQCEAGLLRSFDAFCMNRHYDGPLTQPLAVEFTYSAPDLAANRYAVRYRVLRAFAGYLSNFEPQTELLDIHAIRWRPQRSPAYIYTDEEVQHLLQAVGQTTFRVPFRIVTYQTLIGLIASTGLRIREALNLDLGDVNLEDGVLLVRRSKFRKSRLVPVHVTSRERLRQYRRARDACGAGPDEQAFFVSLRLKRLPYSTINNLFHTLLRRANIRAAVGRQPRIHDLRHTFAVRCVLAWYEAGVDVQAQLPLLSTYMGHAHFEDTAYYLDSAAELLAKAAQRFEQNRSHGHA